MAPEVEEDETEWEFFANEEHVWEYLQDHEDKIAVHTHDEESGVFYMNTGGVFSAIVVQGEEMHWGTARGDNMIVDSLAIIDVDEMFDDGEFEALVEEAQEIADKEPDTITA